MFIALVVEYVPILMSLFTIFVISKASNKINSKIGKIGFSLGIIICMSQIAVGLFDIFHHDPSGTIKPIDVLWALHDITVISMITLLGIWVLKLDGEKM